MKSKLSFLRMLAAAMLFLLCWSWTNQAFAQTCVAAPMGLVSWWPGDVTSRDIHGNNDGVLKNGTGYKAGRVGQGFRFDGVDDLVEIPDSLSHKPQNITVEAWVKFDSLDTPNARLPGLQYIVFKKNTRGENFEAYTLHKIRVNGVDRFRFNISSGSGIPVFITSTTAIITGQFYHVAGTYDILNVTQDEIVNGLGDGDTSPDAVLQWSVNSCRALWQRQRTGIQDPIPRQ